MQLALPDTLARLSKDHIAFRRALNVLERQVNAAGQYHELDFDVLNGVVTYFRDFPGRFHHPVEHLIYAALKKRAPEVEAEIEATEEEHGRIGQELAVFAEAVRRILAEAEISRQAFCKAAHDFIDFERRHIRGEEGSLFYLAVERLTPEDWRDVDQHARALWAPLEQQKEKAHLEKLHADFVAWDFEDAAAAVAGL